MRLSTLPVAESLRFFVDVDLLFSNSHYKCDVFVRVAILMSSMQCVGGYIMYMVPLKDFEYQYSFG